jgi:hypothetical protein
LKVVLERECRYDIARLTRISHRVLAKSRSSWHN